jgi:hypothetical protein
MKIKKKIEKKKVEIKPLKVTQMKSYHIDYEEFDKYVQEVYGKSFNFASDQEASNYSIHDFSVSKKKLDVYNQKKMNAWLTGKGDEDSFVAGVILNDLCNKGLVKSGYYVVSVSW